MEITQKDIKKMLYEIKIMEKLADQWHCGTLMACALNIKRLLKGGKNEGKTL